MPLEGLSFGEKFLGMSVRGFSDCFFMRQDNGEIIGRDELVEAVEKAASARESGEGEPVRAALLALEDCRVHFAELSSNSLTPEVALKRLDERIASARQTQRALEQEKESRAADIARAAEVDAQIAGLREMQARLEHELLLAERAEVDGLLERHRAFESAAQTREARRRELQAFAGYDPAACRQAQALNADLHAASRQMDAARAATERDITGPLRLAEQDLALFAEGLGASGAPDLERLRALRMSFIEQRAQIVAQALQCDELKAELARQGVPVKDFESLRTRIRSLPVADFRAIAEHGSQKAEIQGMLAGSGQRLAEAEAVVERAKARRDHMRTLSSAAFLGALFAVGLVLLFLLLKMGYLSALFAIAAVALAAAGFWQVHKAQVQTAAELDPAVAVEISHESEVKRLRQREADLEADFLAAMERRNLQPGDLDEIRQLGEWSQLLAPYQAAREVLERMELGVGEIRRQAAEAARAVMPAATPEDVDEIFLHRCVKEFERHADTVARRDRLQAAAASAAGDLAAVEARAAELRAGVEALLPADIVAPDMEERLRLFAEGCAKAVAAARARRGPARRGPA